MREAEREDIDRIRDMQKLPYVVVTNSHMSHVYDLYYTAFDTLRKVPEIKTIDDNDRFCGIVKGMLREHLTVIPNLAMGVLECRDLLPAVEMDRFMNKILRSVCTGESSIYYTPDCYLFLRGFLDA